MIRKSITKLSLIVAFILVAGCESKSYEEKVRLSKKEKQRQDSIYQAAFKVGVMPTLDCLPLFIAKEQHLFDTLGVDVRLRPYAAQMDCDTALAHGRVEGSITDLVRAYHLKKKGTPLSYPIATNTYWQLITNRKARISDLKQLSDKMIAITRYSATDMLADIAIDSVKPKYDVYRVQINDVRIRLKMLLNNEMDAMLLTEPQATVARLAKHLVLMNSRDKDLRLGVFAFRDKALTTDHRKEQMKLFLKAYNMAVDSINKNGLDTYASTIMKHCDVDTKTIAALPKKIRFSHATAPRTKDVEFVARKLK